MYTNIKVLLSCIDMHGTCAIHHAPTLMVPVPFIMYKHSWYLCHSSCTIIGIFINKTNFIEIKSPSYAHDKRMLFAIVITTATSLFSLPNTHYIITIPLVH